MTRSLSCALRRHNHVMRQEKQVRIYTKQDARYEDAEPCQAFGTGDQVVRKLRSTMGKVAIYTCAIGNHDWIHRPRKKPEGFDFIRFSNTRPLRPMGWKHADLLDAPSAETARVLSRFPKLRPIDTVPGYDVAIWVDASIEIMSDLRPLLRIFQDTGADVALFPHPSGRTVAEEFDFAIKGGRIGPDFYAAAEIQKGRYAAMGLLDCKVVEASIIFYRLSSPTLEAAGKAWWHEVTQFTERDQVSQPYAMQDAALKIHHWDWHFKQDNPYFRRHPHRPKTLIKRLKAGAEFLSDSRLDYRLVRYGIRGAAAVKRVGQSLRARS